MRPSPSGSSELLDDVRRHDRALRGLGIEIWIGAEPTFTRADSQDPWWLAEAEGGDKEERALALAEALSPRLAPARTARPARVEGRQFPDEPRPRFCFGLKFRRDGLPPADPAPPILDGEAWLTVTPDPGVVEVNMAPAPDVETFLGWGRAVYAAAREVGLSPERYRFNGQAVDSGGGGQITLGGPSPEASPLFRHPELLPGLLRYFNRHPSLSYWFGTECLGSAGQGPRPDEGVRERFEELEVALDLLQRRPLPDGGEAMRERLWAALAPLLVDGSGNAHRAEVNIEKLWNPWLPRRGRLGLVELRALRMEPNPERMAAVGALLRAIAARLAAHPFREPLVAWGAALHDRFGLPRFLVEDLREVLDDLAAHGLDPGPAIAALLLEPRPPLAVVDLGGARLTLTPAVEFWPLLGDVASQERRGARFVDASTARVEVQVEAPAGEGPGSLLAEGHEVTLHPTPGGAFIAGFRYRLFAPQPGLHPGLPAQDPVVLLWRRGGEARRIALHSWIPGGGVYDGLPQSAAEAERRRRERVVVDRVDPRHASMHAPTPSPAGPGEGYTVDLRRKSLVE